MKQSSDRHVNPALYDVAELLHPQETEGRPTEEELLGRGMSQGAVDAQLEGFQMQDEATFEDRSSWVNGIVMAAEHADPNDKPGLPVLEAAREAASQMQRWSDSLDTLIALAVRYTDLSSRTVESAVSMSHQTVKRRAEQGDTEQVRQIVSRLLREEAEHYINAADEMEDRS